MDPTPEEIEAATPRPPPAKRTMESRPRDPYLPEIFRLLPQAPDAERGLLCSFLLAPREIGSLCAEKGITPDWMHLPSHAGILRRLIELWDGNKPIDLISLTQYLRDCGELDQVGGAAFITDLSCFLPTAANAPYYVEILQEKVLLREIIKVCTEHAARGYDEQDQVPELLESLEKKVLGIRRGDAGQMKTVPAKEGAMGAIHTIEAIYERRGGITGIPTGFVRLDKMLDGLHPSQMIVIAARPSMGKTALALNIAEHIALGEKKAVAVYTLEMSSEELHIRLLCSRARVNMHRVREGFLAERDFPALQGSAAKIAESQLFVVDATGTSIAALRAHARRLHQQYPLAAIFVDYLQLLRSLTRQAQNSREREIAEISSGLKGLAKELGIPLVVLAQLNRDVDRRTGIPRPKLSDLRESGSIEQDADVVALLTRDEYYAETDEERMELEGKAIVIIAKQRNGPVGDVPLIFIKEFARFENRAEEAEAYQNPQLGI